MAEYPVVWSEQGREAVGERQPEEPKWYSPKEVEKFRWEHIWWLLEHIALLKNGQYPPDPEAGLAQSSSYFHKGAHFETPKEIYVELMERLERCGWDGLLLLIRHALDLNEWELARFLNQDHKKVHKRTKDALEYTSGRGRRWMRRGKYEAVTYHEFRHHKRSKISDNHEQKAEN